MDAQAAPVAAEPFVFDANIHEFSDDETCIVSKQTGEIVVFIDGCDADADFNTFVPFAINSPERLDWYMRSLFEAGATIADIEAQVRPLRARLDHLGRTYGDQAAALAKSLLTGSSRTVRRDHGQVSFRRTPESIEILNPVAAVDFVEFWRPEEVKKSVNVTAVQAALAAARSMRPSGAEPVDISSFARTKAAGESVTFRTGV